MYSSSDHSLNQNLTPQGQSLKGTADKHDIRNPFLNILIYFKILRRRKGSRTQLPLGSIYCGKEKQNTIATSNTHCEKGDRIQ